MDYEAEVKRLKGINAELVQSHNALLVAIARAEERHDGLHADAEGYRNAKDVLRRWEGVLAQCKADDPGGWILDRSVTTLQTAATELAYALNK